MKHAFLLLPITALALSACAANGDPPDGPTAPGGSAPGPALQAAAPGSASIDARDVAILVVEETPSSLNVVSSAKRPRSSFGPSASWNGSGPATHRWRLVGGGGETLASGSIAARSGIEVPPDPAHGVPAANVPQSSRALSVKVPYPAAGESIEITSIQSPALVVRWP